jgi:hypothetical protein
MKIVNKELENYIDRSEGTMTIASIRKMDRLVSLIKENPGNIQECIRLVAKEFNTTPNCINNMYYLKYSKNIDSFITVKTEKAETTGNTKNDLSVNLMYVTTTTARA